MKFLYKLVELFLSLFVKDTQTEETKTDNITNETTQDPQDSEIVSDDITEDENTLNDNEIISSDTKESELVEESESITEKESDDIQLSVPSEYKSVVVFLDNGHCKSTPGKRSPDKTLYEWEYNRIIVKRIESELDKLGIEHWNTHPEDDWVDSSHNSDSSDLKLRVSRINAKYSEVKKANKKAFMISVHVNAAGSGDWYNATGWSTWTTKGQNNSDKLADCLYDAAEEVLNPLNLKIRTDKSDGDRDWESDFYIIKYSNCVCTLSENFFMDNKSDVEFLLSENGKKAITDIHINGIKKYIDTYC